MRGCLFYYVPMEQKFTPITKIGRQALLKQLQEFKGSTLDTVIDDVPDDAAVYQEQDGSYTLLTTDTFVEGVDFDPTYTPFTHLGYKIISASLSDIYAMNGTPKTVMVNLALPNRISLEMVTDLYKGMEEACKRHHVQMVGGDLTGNHQNAVISITVFGKAEPDKITYRKGAAIGDAICVTGDVGSAMAGLRILVREKKFWQQHSDQAIQPDLEDYKFVVQRQLMPEARLDVIKTFSAHNMVPSSMIDLTKGIIHEVTELCESSGLGAHLYQAALPIAVETRHVADEMEEDVDRYALFGGEDLELIFTMPEEDVQTLFKQFNDFTVIGRMTPQDEGMIMQTAEGELIQFDDLT